MHYYAKRLAWKELASSLYPIPSLATTVLVHTGDKNMFYRPIKIQSFDNESSKFTRPLKNVWRFHLLAIRIKLSEFYHLVS